LAESHSETYAIRTLKCGGALGKEEVPVVFIGIFGCEGEHLSQYELFKECAVGSDVCWAIHVYDPGWKEEMKRKYDYVDYTDADECLQGALAEAVASHHPIKFTGVFTRPPEVTFEVVEDAHFVVGDKSEGDDRPGEDFGAEEDDQFEETEGNAKSRESQAAEQIARPEEGEHR
jgi:hypothetical protein